MLEHDPLVFQQVAHNPLVDRNQRVDEKPPHMGIPEPAVDIVGILFRINMAMVEPVVIGPAQGGHLTGQGRHNQPKPFVDRRRVVGLVGEEPVVTRGYCQT